MSTAELKLSLIKRLTQTEDVNLLKKIKELFEANSDISVPCRFTIDELKHEIDLSEEDDRQGLYYTSADLRKKHPLCKSY